MPAPTIKQVMESVASEFGVTASEIIGNRRHKPIAHARSIAAQTARELTEASYPQLARVFQRDHSTIMHAVKRAAPELLAQYPEYRDYKQRAIEWLQAKP